MRRAAARWSSSAITRGRSASASTSTTRLERQVSRRCVHPRAVAGPRLRDSRPAPIARIHAVAVITLALGIGANSAIFSVVNGVLLEALPYRDAGRLHSVRTVYPDGTPYSLSPPDFMSVRQDTRAFDQVEAYTTAASTMTGHGDPRELQVGRISDGLPALLGWRMAIGRGFDRGEFCPRSWRPAHPRPRILAACVRRRPGRRRPHRDDRGPAGDDRRRPGRRIETAAGARGLCAARVPTTRSARRPPTDDEASFSQ